MVLGFENNIAILGKLGFYFFTHVCLNFVQVWHEVVVKYDGTIELTHNMMVVKLLAIKDINRAACSILNDYGFQVDVFQKRCASCWSF